VLHAEIGFQFALETLDFRTVDEPLAIANARDGLEQLLAERVVLRP
jgi:hypothetical protein